MEKEAKLRATLRGQFTKRANAFEAMLQEGASEGDHNVELHVQFKYLKDVRTEIEELDEKIRNFVLENGDEKALEKELEDATKYKTRWLTLETKFDFLIKKSTAMGQRMKLPKLEIPKFDGDLKNWLPFWGQFRKIHEDQALSAEDKFVYLVQAINTNTEAKQLVDSYPLSSENYIKCIDHLKSRYAREDLQTQLYVRELLNLILQKTTNLATLYDKISAQLRSLETLGVTKKNAAFILPMVESALPEDTLKMWQRMGTHDLNMEKELTNLLAFLQTEVENDQRVKMAIKFKTETETTESTGTASMLHTSANQNVKQIICLFCEKENHSSVECYKLSKLSVEQRREIIKKKRACTVCLKVGHFFKNCKTSIKCLICDKRHSTVLCSNQNRKEERSKVTSQDKEANSTSASAVTPTQTTTLLQTVIVEIEYKGRKTLVRALFDSGAQRTYVKEEIMKNLQVPVKKKEVLTHSLFGGVQTTTKAHNLYNIKINSIDKKYCKEIMALGQETLCNNVPRFNENVNSSLTNVLKAHKITLTDKNDHSKEIGLLIGADYLGNFITGQVISLQDDGLVAINTKLGWTLQGKQVSVNVNNITSTLFCSNHTNDFTDYWALETLGIQDPAEIKTKEMADKEVMTSFKNSIRINEENRYEVRLPFKTGQEDLLSNFHIAKKRLDTTTTKLISSGKFNEYHEVLQDWHRTGIIEKVLESDVDHNKGHYLPHRAVVKESSLTSTLRPVFDASAKDKNGLCLNACLEKGLNMIHHIPTLISGFRTGAIGITSDIQKAFLQISLPPEDRDYLKFLWWDDKNQKNVVTYRHCRVVFGLTSSPFLLAATLQHHLSNITDPYTELLKKSWYVDNCITSLDSEQETLHFINKSKEIMSAAKFKLRMWVTAPLKINETGKRVISVLGLNWDTETDQLYCSHTNMPAYDELKQITKRELLSLIQKIFDPIGYTSPATLTPKLILQDAWVLKLGWDSKLPTVLFDKFKEWYKYFEYLNKCKIPRSLSTHILKTKEISIHLFCDASKNAYAAGVLLRSEKEKKVSVQLVLAKSRITPPKQISIPRLELLAALIGSRLLSEVRKNEYFQNCPVYCWTDSSVVLCWIKRELPLNNFVGNRIKEIRQHSNTNDWHHIPGTDNWADLASRGCTAKALHDCRWWEGPAWLSLTPDQWPQSEVIVDECEVQSETKKVLCNAQVSSEENILDSLQKYFSKYGKLVRTVAWIYRFKNNAQNVKQRRKGEITYHEYEKAERRIIKMVQESDKEYLQKDSRNLTKTIDEEGLLRIKTKLTLSDFPEHVRTPYLLTAKNPVVKIMVRQRHEQLQHAGVDQLITDLRARFWIIGIRRLTKSVVASCIICKRYKSKPTQAPTAPLPPERLSSSAPFQNTGVDLAGPLILKNGEKCWVVLYTCAVYRAVHLELTLSLSTEAFIMTMRRFISRRGRTEIMLSDQGTNFYGTKNLLSLLDWEEIQRHSTIRRMQWKMNAPSAAWWGGFWERLIRIMKDLLRRIIGNAILKYEELATILCECEAVMNGRPLTYINNDGGDCLEPLTPAHFILPANQPSTQTSDFDYIDRNSLNNRLKFIQNVRDQFKDRFKAEYLTCLTQKGKEIQSNLKVGDVVLIETTEKRIKWPLGVIQKLLTGRDGIERIAEVKTSQGMKVRPIQRLYSLEISSDSPGVFLPKPDSNPNDSNNKISLNQPIPCISKFSERDQPEEPLLSRFGRQVRFPSKFNIYHKF